MLSLDGITTTQVLEVATGFFFVMWVVALANRKPKQRRWYRTEVPSTLIIEHEA